MMRLQLTKILLVWLLLAPSFIGCKKEKREDVSINGDGQVVMSTGNKVWVNRSGTAEKAIIFLSGFDAPKEYWQKIQGPLSEKFTTLSYDRPGYGKSDYISTEQDAVSISRELHELIEKSHIAKPYIVVGHSFGGCIAMVYAGLYPQEVKGLVILDAPHQDKLRMTLPYLELIANDLKFEGSKSELRATAATIEQLETHNGALKVPTTIVSNMLPEDGEDKQSKEADFQLHSQWISDNPNGRHIKSYKGHLIPVNDAQTAIDVINYYY